MGQCGAKKLQSDAVRVPSHSPSCSKETSVHRFARALRLGRGKPSYAAVHVADQTGSTVDELLDPADCSPFVIDPNEPADCLPAEECAIHSDRRQHLLDVRFNRTLFCEDITYEYNIACNVLDVADWTVRLTVDQLTEFFTETAAQWKDVHDAHIPDQCGKVMQPHVFTALLQRVVDEAGILRHEDAFFSQRAANLLSIPYELRSIVQYNGEQYASEPEEAVLGQFSVCLESGFKYLSHRPMVFPHDYRYDDCCTLYDAPEVECISFWIRSLQKKVDFQFNLLSNNVFTMLMSDAAFVVTEAILAATQIDESSAWIITDFLPKELWSEHGDARCDAQIVYKYDPRGFTPECRPFGDEEESLDLELEDEGDFLLFDPDNAMLLRHGMALEEVHALCVSLRKQCTTLSLSKRPELSPGLSSQSISEFIEFSRSATSDGTVGSGIPLYSPLGAKLKGERESSPSVCGSESSVAASESSEVDEQYRLFFAAFVDEEEADDVNLYQWIKSLAKLNLELSEAELVAAFNWMLRQNVDSEGYVDFVDFTQFCREPIAEERFKSAQRAQHVLKNFIVRK